MLLSGMKVLTEKPFLVLSVQKQVPRLRPGPALEPIAEIAAKELGELPD